MPGLYKILSLDGGGSWALIQVKALIDLYGPETSGRAVLSKFDLAVATSGGSVVLGGLLEDKSLADILAEFMDDAIRRSISQPTNRIFDRLLHGLLKIGPQFSTRKKLPALRRLFPDCGDETLPELAQGIVGSTGRPIHLLITSFDFDRNIAVFFRSGSTGGPEWGDGAASHDATLAEAIHASGSAPVQYYDAPASWNGDRYWDGAITGCNNPVLAGVAEAITLDVRPSAIRALSIGTGTVRHPGPPLDDPPPFIGRRSPQGLFSDIAKLAGSITDDPPESASFLAHIMTGGREGLPAGAVSHIVRLSPIVGPVSDGEGGWRAPGDWTPEQLTQLASIDLAALRHQDVECIADYADLWMSSVDPINQPLRMDADSLRSKLGPSKYREAVDQWRLIAP
jgi:hypothetical protein